MHDGCRGSLLASPFRMYTVASSAHRWGVHSSAVSHEGSRTRPSCLFSADTCGDLLVTLQSLSRQGEKRSLQLSGRVNSMTFTFDTVLPGKYKSKNQRQHLVALTYFLSFLNFPKPSSQIASQLHTCLPHPLTLNVHYLAMGDNARISGPCAHCHLVRTMRTCLLFAEGALICAILFLNA